MGIQPGLYQVFSFFHFERAIILKRSNSAYIASKNHFRQILLCAHHATKSQSCQISPFQNLIYRKHILVFFCNKIIVEYQRESHITWISLYTEVKKMRMVFASSWAKPIQPAQNWQCEISRTEEALNTEDTYLFSKFTMPSKNELQISWFSGDLVFWLEALIANFNEFCIGKLLAFSGPSAVSENFYGYRTKVPEDYCPYFRQSGVSAVIRLNRPVSFSNFNDLYMLHKIYTDSLKMGPFHAKV